MKNKSLIIISTVVGVILLIPFIAMQYTGEVNWSLFDFIVAGALLFGAGLGIDFALKKVIKKEYRVLSVIGILVVLFLVWAELAVGVFGTPFAGS